MQNMVTVTRVNSFPSSLLILTSTRTVVRPRRITEASAKIIPSLTFRIQRGIVAPVRTGKGRGGNISQCKKQTSVCQAVRIGQLMAQGNVADAVVHVQFIYLNLSQLLKRIVFYKLHRKSDPGIRQVNFLFHLSHHFCPFWLLRRNCCRLFITMTALTVLCIYSSFAHPREQLTAFFQPLTACSLFSFSITGENSLSRAQFLMTSSLPAQNPTASPAR